MKKRADLRERTAIIKHKEGMMQLVPVIDPRTPQVVHVEALAGVKEQKKRSKKQAAKTDPIHEGVEDLFNEDMRNVERFKGQSSCWGKNVLHSTATESELPKPGSDYRYFGNLTGLGPDVHIIVGSLKSHRVREPKALKERGIANELLLPNAVPEFEVRKAPKSQGGNRKLGGTTKNIRA